MNSIKALEADSGELFKQIGQIEGVDPRLLALAKTNLQQGFMWFVRSIAKPADPFGSVDEQRHSLAPRAADKPIFGVHPIKPGKLLIVRTPQVLSDVQRTQQLSRYQIAADQVGACLLLLDGGAAASLE